MKVKDIRDEVFQDYKKPSMLISMCECDWKCFTERGLNPSICQNSAIAQQPDINVSIPDICDRYITNFITFAVVIGGLEPMLQFGEVIEFIRCLREDCLVDDDVVIYTGYYPEEIQDELDQLSQYKNIIVKFGRYRTDLQPHFDEVLGITLASSNQYALKIS